MADTIPSDADVARLATRAEGQLYASNVRMLAREVQRLRTALRVIATHELQTAPKSETGAYALGHADGFLRASDLARAALPPPESGVQRLARMALAATATRDAWGDVMGALTPETVTLFTPELIADLIAADIRLIETVGPDGAEPMESPQELAVIIVRYASDRLALARDWQRQRARIETLEKALRGMRCPACEQWLARPADKPCGYCHSARAALAPTGAPDGE